MVWQTSYAHFLLFQILFSLLVHFLVHFPFPRKLLQHRAVGLTVIWRETRQHSGKESAWQCKRHKRSLVQEDSAEKKMETTLIVPGKFHGQRSIVGYRPWDLRVGHCWAGTRVRQCRVIESSHLGIYFHIKIFSYTFHNFLLHFSLNFYQLLQMKIIAESGNLDFVLAHWIYMLFD